MLVVSEKKAKGELKAARAKVSQLATLPGVHQAASPALQQGGRRDVAGAPGAYPACESTRRGHRRLKVRTYTHMFVFAFVFLFVFALCPYICIYL